MRKRFDRELYNANDTAARNAVKELFKGNKKFTVVDNKKKMGVDLLAVDLNGETLFNIETEIKRVWNGKFKYDTVQFPERKSKFAQLEKPTFYIMFNNDLSEYLVVKGEDLLTSPLKEVPNKYVFKGELFYQVPVNKVVFNNINVVK